MGKDLELPASLQAHRVVISVLAPKAAQDFCIPASIIAMV